MYAGLERGSGSVAHSRTSWLAENVVTSIPFRPLGTF
jgi:hypothetical protein